MAKHIPKTAIPSVHSNNLPRFLQRAKVPRLFLLVGEEDYHKEKAVEAVVKKVRADRGEAKVLRLALADLSPGELAQECGTSDLFGGGRIIFVQGTEGFATEDAMAVIPKSMAPGVFLLMSLGKKASVRGMRGPAGKTLIVSCPKVYEEKMPQWLQGQFNSRFGKSLSPKAAITLVQLAGQDLSQLDSQLEKLDLYTGTRKSIAEEDVRSVIGLEREFATYEIVNAVSQKNARLALRTLKEAYSRGAKLSAIVTWIGGRFRDLLRAKRILASRGQKAIAAELGVKPFLARIIAGQAKEFDEGEIEEKLSLVLKTQSMVRSGGGPEEVLTETLIVRLCRG